MSKPPRAPPSGADLLNLLAKYFELREQEDETGLARSQITRQILERRGHDHGLETGRAIADAASQARDSGDLAPTPPKAN